MKKLIFILKRDYSLCYQLLGADRSLSISSIYREIYWRRSCPHTYSPVASTCERPSSKSVCVCSRWRATEPRAGSGSGSRKRRRTRSARRWRRSWRSAKHGTAATGRRAGSGSGSRPRRRTRSARRWRRSWPPRPGWRRWQPLARPHLPLRSTPSSVRTRTRCDFIKVWSH